MLQEMREKAGLSQSGLAKKAGLPVRSIQNWEQSHRVPRGAAVLALARALGVPANKMFLAVAEQWLGQAREAEAKPKPRGRKKGGA
jgi:transcriptional regulator with XRE-family HTH domain